MKLIEKIRGIIKFIFALVCAGWIFFLRKRSRKLIVLYHGIAAVERESFCRQIEYIVKKYKVLRLSEIVSVNHNDGGDMIAITFDDAFENLLDNAIPVLSQKGISAAIFVPADYINQTPGWDIPLDCMDRKEKIMSTEQLVQLDKAGFEIYSHTMTHPRLANLDDDTLWQELYNSKKEIEEILGHTVNAISYPHGYCNSKVFEMSQRVGYEYGFTIEPEFLKDQNNNLALPRIPMLPLDNFLVFKLRLMGAYGLVTKYFQKIKFIMKEHLIS